MKWFFLILAVVLNAGANVTLKIGSRVAKPLPETAGFTEKLFNFLNPVTCIAIFVFAANVLAYRKALDAFNISIAYPVMASGGLVLITAAAWAIPALGERLHWWQFVGIVLIGIGIWILLYEPSPAAG